MIRPARWRVDYLPAARKQLSRLRQPVFNQIRAAIRSLADDPFPADSIEMRGKGQGLHRMRVGTYRVVYRVQAEQVRVLVIRVGHRRDVYSGWEGM